MNKKEIWFPAKKYGWGWGPPCAWQGWLVMVGFVLLMAGSALLLLPKGHVGAWIGIDVTLVSLLLLICLAKGEKARWRWGKN